ncbi:MAG: DUF6680 family protein [Caulobacterales bacterium]
MIHEQSREVSELNLRAAYSAHDRFYGQGALLFQSVLTFGDSALKAAAILNGGAAVAMLAFIGAMLTSDRSLLSGYSSLADILTVFGFGVLCSTLASGASYCAQIFYEIAHSENRLDWTHPFIHETPKVRLRSRIGIVFQVLAIGLVVMSYAAFAVGGEKFRAFSSNAFEEFSGQPVVMTSSPRSQDRVSENRAVPRSDFQMNAETTNFIVAIGSITAALVGPVAAVLITLRWESIRRSREGRQTLLQTLLATRGRASDPSFSWAIQTTPLHFSQNRSVVNAHALYMDQVRLRVPPEQQAAHDSEIGRRLGLLISEMMKDLGYRGLTSEQIEAYTAQGLADREELFRRALIALPVIAFHANRSADAAEQLLARMPRPSSEE